RCVALLYAAREALRPALGRGFPFALLALSALLLIAALPSARAQQVATADSITLTYLFSDGNLSGTLQAYRSLLEEQPELAGRIDLQFLTESFFDSVDPQALAASDVLVLDMMNQPMLERFNTSHETDLIAAVAEQGKVLAVGVGVQPLEHYTEQGAVWDERAQAYWQHGGQLNQLSLMKQALTLAGIEGLDIAEPQPGLDFGYYYPDGNGGRAFASWDEFDAWRQANGKTAPGRPRVAIGFYRAAF